MPSFSQMEQTLQDIWSVEYRMRENEISFMRKQRRLQRDLVRLLELRDFQMAELREQELETEEDNDDELQQALDESLDNYEPPQNEEKADKDTILDFKNVSYKDIEDKKECCSICLSSFEDEQENICETDCKHYFHNGCIRGWCKQKMECPNCKKKIKKKSKKKSIKNFSDMRVVDLKKICKDNGIFGYSKLRKVEIIKMLEDYGMRL